MVSSAKALKSPSVQAVSENGKPVVLTLLGKKSPKVGSLKVTDGGPYGSNEWYGYISPEGVWSKTHKATADIEAAVKHLGSDPAGAAKGYAKLTGKCCFCNLPLHGENEISVSLGYGPTCAKNFGLSWGKLAIQPDLKAEEETQTKPRTRKTFAGT